jgi:hypothetical protein
MLNARPGFASAAAVAVLALWSGGSSAQVAQPDPPRQSAPLPASFAVTAGDVLTRLFPDYIAASGRVPSIRDEDGQPAKVWIGEAKQWKGDHLVLVLRIAADASEAESGLCGACLGHALLAVVKGQGRSLALVAMGQAPKSLGSSDPDDVIGFGGHSSLALDLAPYSLNKEETLIGLRQDTIWREIRSDSLQLYRMTGGHLDAVFQTNVADFDYPSYDQLPRIVVKTTAVIAPVPSSQTFYDLRVTRTVNRCTDRNDDDDCNVKDEPVRRVRTTVELWRFDGTQYRLVKGR